ncbi:ABC transporter permease [Gemmatimonas sp.]|jgi:putative ABC transport system permease protein|uniref:ABC transporter permease n=1 Tax=Gemmatimonas sp. TaxID=1962908 RepID=UPI0022C89332|nr:ABC transporter permease [Gemmatimonas sp.]MCZ8204350.1 ABC transporter permease [Gemmatimonas sp.]
MCYRWRAVSAALVLFAALAACPALAPTAGAQGDTILSPTYGRRAPTVRGIAVDARMAEDFGLRPGAVVRLSGTPGVPGDSVTVAAVFERRADPAEVARREYRIRTHVDHLQQLLALDDRVDRFAVGVPDSVPIDSAVARINHVAFGFRAHKSADVAVQSSRTFRVVERFHRAIGLITVVASAVFLLCLLLLSVEERRRDIAALRLMGISQATVVRAIVIEAALVSVIGSVIGAGIGWVASLIVNAHFQQVYRTPLLFALLTPEIFAFATLTSLVLGIAAGAVAAWRLVRTPPLTLLGR